MSGGRLLAIIQARVSSTRLPGKVLEPILGAPMLVRQAERVRRSRRIGAMVVATSTDPSDDPIERLCADEGLDCFRGPLDDVLGRFYLAASARGLGDVMRLTGDCPLSDPKVIDGLAAFFFDGDYDYASNTIEPTFPDGLDAEVFKFAALETAFREAVLKSEREHVTPFIVNHPERFRLGSYRGPSDLSGMRWTVDEPEDLELVRRIYGELYPVNGAFDTGDVLALLSRRPELAGLNGGFSRNEGYLKSLLADKASGGCKGGERI